MNDKDVETIAVICAIAFVLIALYGAVKAAIEDKPCDHYCCYYDCGN